MRLWLLPRGHYKTSLITIAGSVFCLLNNPSERILIASSVLQNAKDMVTEIGNFFIRDELFRQLYTEYCPANPKMPDTTWTTSAIELPNRQDFNKMEKSVEAHGADSSIVSRHYSRMFLDDLVAPGNIETVELRKKIMNYVKAVLSLREDPATPIDFIGTRWHDDDMYGEITKWEDVETIKIPAEYFEDGVKKAIFPEVYPMEELQKIKRDQGSYLYSSLYLLDPIPEEMQVFKSSWFVHYDWTKEIDRDTNYHFMRREDDGAVIKIGRRFMTVDPAKTEGAGDYSAIIVNTTDEENNWYIVDLWRKQVNPMKLCDQIIDMQYFWFCHAIGIETVAYQEMLKLYIEEKVRREGLILNIVEIKGSNRISKELKIKSLQPMFESRCIYLPRDNPVASSLQDELERFPAGKNDDLADALQMQKELIFPSSNTIVNKPKVDNNALEVWKKRLKLWRKNPGKFFHDYQQDYKELTGRV